MHKKPSALRTVFCNRSKHNPSTTQHNRRSSGGEESRAMGGDAKGQRRRPRLRGARQNRFRFRVTHHTGYDDCRVVTCVVCCSNSALRDPSMYRCRPEAHHRTGTKYKVYPLYDFACPIIDSLGMLAAAVHYRNQRRLFIIIVIYYTEGITHALRSNEYNLRNPLYNWVCEKVCQLVSYCFAHTLLIENVVFLLFSLACECQRFKTFRVSTLSTFCCRSANCND
jgi:hypothetical protein